jgi:hypothetical protein
MFLKQSTARNLAVFITDLAYVNGKTGLSAGLTIYLSKDGAAAASISPSATEIDSVNMPGWYSLALTTGHTDTLGDFALHITAAAAGPTDLVRQVVLDLPGIAQTGDCYARLGAPVGASISADIAGVAAGVMASVIEGTMTLLQATRGFASALLSKASGLATTTAVYRNTTDTKDRITATVDSSGNRSAVTLDLS